MRTIYRDPLWLALALARYLLMLRFGHHLPDLLVAAAAGLGLWRAWVVSHR